MVRNATHRQKLIYTIPKMLIVQMKQTAKKDKKRTDTNSLAHTHTGRDIIVNSKQYQ